MGLNNLFGTPQEAGASKTWQLSAGATRALQIGVALLAVKNLVDVPWTGPIGLLALGLDVAIFFLVRRRSPRVPRLIVLRVLTLTLLLIMPALLNTDPLAMLLPGIIEGWLGGALILLSAGRPGKALSIAGLALASLGLLVYLLIILSKLLMLILGTPGG